MSTTIVLLSVVAIAAIVAVMATPALRTRIVGESPLAHAAIPLLAAGFVWLANWSGSVLVGAVSDASAPMSNLKVFIEDIQFGLPDLPEDYTKRALTADEVKSLLSPLRRSPEIVQLTEKEATRLNDITRESNQAGEHPVAPHRSYNLKDIVNEFEGDFHLYYRYHRWASITKKWADFLDSQRDTPPADAIRAFAAREVYAVANAPGIFRSFAGMVALEKLQVPAVPDDCTSTPELTGIRVRSLSGDLVVDWGNWGSAVATLGDDRTRVTAGRRLGELISKACIGALSELFKKMAPIFDTEAKHMKTYLEEWRHILKTRKSKNIDVTVTVSNVGKFDTYIRRQIRAAVGAQGRDKISFTLVSHETDPAQGPYLAVKTRTAQTFRFRASLDIDIRDRVHGAFTSGLNYIRVAILASSGESNETVFSPALPFSTDAREAARNEVESIQIVF